MNTGDWFWTGEQNQICQIIETQTLWGETICRVWLPDSDSMVCVPASKLVSFEDSEKGTANRIAYIASAARIADALTQSLFENYPCCGRLRLPMAASATKMGLYRSSTHFRHPKKAKN